MHSAVVLGDICFPDIDIDSYISEDEESELISELSESEMELSEWWEDSGVGT